ncbi:serine carboxypeptidase-like 7 isoform X2 [Spinacia oleracea]|uniref:Serine carboxypeptidase-like 7 isoform X2 n=1 Tax=Spinacia oleracea TaxID=3562 RepID=A0ABM3RK11_SPIOL|nr:serine carboxypeptidase-like 7 isoform X2 [Spinacia oleracea]
MSTSNILSLLFILTSISHAASSNVIKSVPGFPGNLPFYLETGYVRVGENDEVQLFYYFIKSERDPEKDPLMLWLTGGPGCSALSGLVLEIVSRCGLNSTMSGSRKTDGHRWWFWSCVGGCWSLTAHRRRENEKEMERCPLNFNTSACNWHSKSPTFQLNPSSWTKVASIIFLDSPVGTGFSYATNPEGYYTDDITSSRHIYQFLRKWLMDHDGFKDHPLFISGDSYCGKIVPIVVQEISNGNRAGFEPAMNLQGYVLGNPYTRKEDDNKSKFYYAHRVSLLSDDLYESATRINCNGTYVDVDVDKDNVKCTRILQAISYESIYYLLENWANDIQTQAALHIQKGTKSSWIRCNMTLAYAYNVESSFGYHQNFTQDFIRALIYSGDQDMKISYVGTLEWIKMLNVSTVEDWRPWFVNGQVAGYTTKFSNDRYHVTFATVKGAGHTAPEYKRLECFTMLLKWFAMHPL